MGFGVIGSHTIGRSSSLGIAMFIFAEVPRILLPLPFIYQPRLETTTAWLIVLGVIIFAASLFFGTPVYRIKPLTGSDRQNPLRTDRLYAIIRHPLMLCDIFWLLGWSLIFSSILGIVLTPVWWLIIYVLTFVEDEASVREYGDAYREYHARVPLFIPRLIHNRRRSIDG